MVDYREKWFIQRIGQSCQTGEQVAVTKGNINLNVKICNLEVGDFIIQNTTDNNNQTFVIERKTVKDLCASITDGRFRQQKERLVESLGDTSKIIFLIEGSIKSAKFTKDTQTISNKAIIDGSILNLIFRHDMKTLHTENEDDSFDKILLLYKKVQNNEFNAPQTPSRPVQLLAKGNKIKENMMAIQLSVIPGVSYATALKIAKCYPNMKCLIHAYDNIDDSKQRALLLAGIEVNTNRKLGIALSTKIYNALTGDTVQHTKATKN